jgi:hypothetical protein
MLVALLIPPLFGQDTVVVDTSGVPQPPAAGSGLCGFLDPYQMPLVQAISAGLLWVFAQISPAFANAGDWVKRFAAFLAGTAIAFIVAKLGCTPNAELSTGAAAALSGFIAALVNWLMFRIVKTQPSGATA